MKSVSLFCAHKDGFRKSGLDSVKSPTGKTYMA